ncbi:ABC transporter substrate-binding protein [Leucobacter sp. UCD-THU]|nr:ABC transporter substrate-binding protein [Leucobacter sp. UCD-THU]
MKHRGKLFAAALVPLALVISGCGANADAADGEESFKFGFIMPDHGSPRYTQFDYPGFETEILRQCPSCEVLFADSNHDPSEQQRQVESMLTQGIDVLVLDPVDSKGAASFVNSADRAGVPVIAYDRTIESDKVSFAVGVNWPEVGKVQAESLVAALEAKDVPKDSDAGIAVIWGDLQSEAGFGMKEGALPVLEASGYPLLGETDTWDGPTVQSFVSSQISRVGADQIVGVFAANDGNAGATIAAFRSSGFDGTLPPITGLDATLAGVQQVIEGNQYMTTYTDPLGEGAIAADVALKLAKGEPIDYPEVDGVPTQLVEPVAVTVDKIQSELIDSGAYTAEDLCSAEKDLVAECEAAGIK